jgi:hypothetical protein
MNLSNFRGIDFKSLIPIRKRHYLEVVCSSKESIFLVASFTEISTFKGSKYLDVLLPFCHHSWKNKDGEEES